MGVWGAEEEPNPPTPSLKSKGESTLSGRSFSPSRGLFVQPSLGLPDRPLSGSPFFPREGGWGVRFWPLIFTPGPGQGKQQERRFVRSCVLPAGG
jgi:hypothetical protein